jgi:hypothetical protein
MPRQHVLLGVHNLGRLLLHRLDDVRVAVARGRGADA